MTALLNLVVPIIILAWTVVAYQKWNKNKDLIQVFTHYLIPMICVIYAYQLIQPSYLPKGDVPEMKRIPFEYVQHETEDRLRAPKVTDDERKKDFEEMLNYKNDVDDIIGLGK